MKDLILIYANTSFFILHFPVWMQDEGVKEKCTENMVGLGQSFCCHFCLENYVRKMKFYISTKLYILKLYLFIGEGGREEGRKEGREGERREGGIDRERDNQFVGLFPKCMQSLGLGCDSSGGAMNSIHMPLWVAGIQPCGLSPLPFRICTGWKFESVSVGWGLNPLIPKYYQVVLWRNVLGHQSVLMSVLVLSICIYLSVCLGKFVSNFSTLIRGLFEFLLLTHSCSGNYISNPTKQYSR